MPEPANYDDDALLVSAQIEPRDMWEKYASLYMMEQVRLMIAERPSYGNCT